jgi:hypothetical protein
MSAARRPVSARDRSGLADRISAASPARDVDRASVPVARQPPTR